MSRTTFRELTPLNEALELCRQQVGDQRVAVEQVAADQAGGRVLAELIRADLPLPNFRRSIRDGYAVKASDTFSVSTATPTVLEIVGAVRIGQVPEFGLRSGQAALIPTGGMLPEGADAVAMVEHTDRIGTDSVQIFQATAPGQYVRQVGEALPLQAEALTAGTVLDPACIGLLAALGRTEISVYQWPRIGILSTGDEIVASSANPAPAQTRDANAHSLAAACQASGGQPEMLGIIPDDRDRLLAAAQAALDDCALLLISGGSSAGTRDITRDALDRLSDGQVFVDGMAIRPGKPTIVAACDGKLAFGLPGHPVSALIVFHRLVYPVIAWLTGTEPTDRSQTARITRNVPSEAGLTQYIRVHLRREGKDCWAEPLFGKSASLSTLSGADGFIEIAAGVEGLTAGEVTSVIMW